MLIEGLAPGLDFRIRAHRKIALLVALTLVALSLTLMMPAAAEASPIYRTTSLGINSRACPEISGGRLVWQAEVNYADQIFTWTAADGQSQLTSADYYHPAGSPDVSGDRVVWYSTDGVWTWTPNDGPSLIGPGGGSSQVSGDRVVWTAGGEIFTWTPTGGPFQITSDATDKGAPQVSGDRVVWQGDYAVYTWTPGVGIVKLADTSNINEPPRVSADRVAWEASTGSGWEVYTWTSPTGVNQLTSDNQYDLSVQVSGDRVVWSAHDRSDIFMWTPTAGKVQLSVPGTVANDYPQIDGDLVAWVGYPAPGSLPQVYIWTPTGGVSMLSSPTKAAGIPRVTGERVIWQSYAGSKSETLTASPVQQIAGVVEGADGTPLGQAGVVAVLNPDDPHFDLIDRENNVIGRATTSPGGNYLIEADGFRGTGLPLNSLVDITASKSGYLSVTQSGEYGRSFIICNFQAFDTMIGPPWEDRRLPVDTGQGSPSPYQHLLPDFVGAIPTITGLSPGSGPTGGGTTVTITGKDFTGLYGPSAVAFGGTNAVSYAVDSDTQITAVAPPHVNGQVEVLVRAAGGTAGQAYTYIAPTITSVSPTMAGTAGGIPVTIRGSGFAPVATAGSVWFGGVKSTNVTVNSDTEIVAVAPPHEPGTVYIIVDDAADSTGQHTSGRFTYVVAPTITSISPSSGSAAGGNSVTITGTGFAGISGLEAVTFGGVNASYSVSSSTRINATAPAHAVGTVRVKVTAIGGSTADTPAAQFVYTQPRPTITSMSPSCGPISGGTSVVITGNYFTGLSGAAAVKFGDLTAAGYTVNSATQITAVSPAHALGTVRVTVTASGGTSADTTADDFVYLPNYGTTEQFVPLRITNNSYEDGVWQVSGDRVVFGAASDPTDYENEQVYTWTPSEGTVLLSTTSHENQRGRVYGDRVVWYGYVGSDLGNGEIFTWTPTTGLVQITKNSGDDQTPEVYGDRVVWAGHDTNSIYQIYTWTPSGGTKKISSETSNPAYPVVSGDRISWCGDRTTVVKTWTAATGIVNVSELEDAGYKHGLKASGDRLVWTSDNGVFTWTPADGIVRITPDAADAQVSGDRVVWSIWSGLNFQVFTWTPTGGVIQLSAGGDGGQAPQVSGDFVVWVSYPASGAVIRGWTPAGGLIEVGASQCVPAVSGDRVAWSAGEFGDSDVYTAIVRPISSAAVSGNSPATGPTIGGTTVVITGSGFSALSSASAASKSSAVSSALTAATASAVSFGDAPALSYTIDSDKQITAVAPPHAAGKVDVYVETSTGASARAGSGNDYTYVPASLTRIENTDSHLRYSGTWALSTTPAGVYSAGSCSSSQSAGASMTVSFSGTTLDWIATRDHTGRSATVSVDGGTPMTVSLYSLSPQYQARVWSTGWLPNGAHVVTITRVTGPLNVDAFDTNGTLVSFGRYDHTNENIVKTGTWADYLSTPSYLGSYGRSLTPNATATVYFTGTKIAWIGMKGGTPGIVDVYLDDAKKATLDLYAYPAQYQQTLWTSETFPDGPHHLDLVRSSASASTEYLVLDAVDIWGTIQAAPPAITSLSPTSGSTLGGTSVTINGGGFTDVTAVTFDGASVPHTLNSSTRITVTAPAHAEGTVPVQVTTSAGTASSTFTYVVAPATTRTDVKKTTTAITTGTTWSGTWASYTSASAFSGSYMRSSTAGAYVLIVFKGTRLDWIAMKGTSTGIADVYVDGSATKAATVDLRATSASYQQNVWTSGPLANGYHTVKIVRSPSSATGKYLTIDAIDIAGTLVSTTPSSATRIEENATLAQSLFLWSPDSPSWIVGKSSSASGGTYRYTNTAGASVTINFTGPSISLLAKTASNFGNITVTLDGVAKTVSLYSPAVLYRKTVYSSGFLTPGNHTLVIARAGTKSSSSAGYTVDIDAIYLIGELR